MDSRPPPPPHGASNNTGGTANGSRSSNLPPGNYDIFVIPPHSAGSGFLYLPSLQPHRNSFLAGVASTLVVVGRWVAVIPAVKHWASSVAASGGMAVFLLVIAVGVLGWAAGKTQVEKENTSPAPGAGGQTGTSGTQRPQPGPQPFSSAGPKPSWQRAAPDGAASGWEKARAETQKRQEEKRKQEEAEKEKAKAREKEAREKAAREKVAQDRLRRENEAKAKENAAKEKEKEREKEPARAAAHAAGTGGSATKNYKHPTAQSYAGEEDEYSFRPYDSPKQPKQHNSNSSFVSTSSWAPSNSTARTTPPPSHRGPYTNKDPDKISIKAVYAFTDAFPKPVAQLVAGMGSVTDGLILKMTTEGLFIDDDVRGVGQREWDVKAWTLRLVEVCCPQFASRAGPSTLPARYSAKAKDPIHRFFAGGGAGGSGGLSSDELDRVIEELLRVCKGSCGSNSSSSLQSGELKGKHVLKASVRDAENKKYYFIIDAAESWKVAVGLQRLRRGTQVRSLGVSGLPVAETKGILTSLGWVRE